MEIRDKFYDFITRKDEVEKTFRSLSLFDKKRIMQILNDTHLNYLFEELVLNYKIITKEDFFAYLKKKYTPKIGFLNSLQLIQLSSKLFFYFLGSEEIHLFSNPYRNIFDHLTKRKLLLSNDNLNILYENDIKNKKNEQNFWKEFLNNQKKNKSEIVGGIKPIFFINEEEKIIKLEKEKIKPLSSSSVTGNNLNVSSATTKNKIPKRFENLELHKNYAHKNYGTCLSVDEFDYKDKEMKKISAALSEEEEFNRKETANFIENINNYSIRKIENINFINQFNFAQRLIKNKQSRIDTENNQQMIIENVKGVHYEKISLMATLNEMKNKRNSNLINVKNQSVETFKKINDLINTNAIANTKLNISEQEKSTIENLKWKINLIRDLYYIHYNLRQSHYTEEVKRIKKANIKKLTQDIEEKISKFENEENLSPIIKANLEILRSSTSKLKQQ